MSAPYHPVVAQIRSLLDASSVWYATFEHEAVTTSEEAAAVRTGYTLSQGAKALIVTYRSPAVGDRIFAMLVLPADRKLDNKKVKKLLGVGSYSFATPDELTSVTGGVERGGVPPFGNLFHMSVYVDPVLNTHEKIIFNAGDRRYSIAMRSADYLSIVSPIVIDLTI